MKTVVTNKLNDKKAALAEYLLETGDYSDKEIDNISLESADTSLFDINGAQFCVFTDEEANNMAREDILSSMWAFNANFIIKNSRVFKFSDERQLKAIQNALTKLQEQLYEDANPIIMALIDDIDAFVEAAIESDGRGHFISLYDGEEIAFTYNCKEYYIYRMD